MLRVDYFAPYQLTVAVALPVWTKAVKGVTLVVGVRYSAPAWSHGAASYADLGFEPDHD